ncbi:unnamed protein product [Leptosia nina]|uniref:Uncharacterized protein n=1 Tax=Leptosia nina TaxID=320188 RepID=A0AAV1JJD7_9NEOP
MERGEGMVAVVRGLKDSGLAVTLLDGTRQYTLQPNSCATPHMSYTTAAQCNDAVRSESGVQATDGRYASTYKTMHCHVKPTSPQTEVTEFPPQRAELRPGQGNFEIGGSGSGERYQAKKSNNYRGGLSWPDQGSVFASRPSLQPDSFASSLRKYPSMSPERSSEVMERLISFAHNKSSIKVKSPSPTRTMESESFNPNICLESLRNASPTRIHKTNDLDINLQSHRRVEESPTRDRTRRIGECDDSWNRGIYARSHDVRYLKEVTKVVKDGLRGTILNVNHPERHTGRHENSSPVRRTQPQKSCNSVNMEIQAAVQMVSREVVTLPRVVPLQKDVAVPLTPTPSRLMPETRGAVSLNPSHVLQQPFSKSYETKSDIRGRMIRSDDQCFQNHINRRSISDEELRLRRNKREFLRTLKKAQIELSKAKCRPGIRNNLKTGSKRQVLKERDCLRNSISTKYPNIYYTEIASKKIDEDDLADLLEDWLSIIPLKPTDYFGRPIEKEYLFYDLFERLKFTAYNLPDHNRREKLKADIIELLNEFPVDCKGNKQLYFGRLADILIDKIKSLSKSGWGKRRTDQNSLNSFCDFAMNRYIPPTESELRRFITNEIDSFVNKIGPTLGRYTKLGLADELLDIMIVYMENVHSNDDQTLKQDVIQILYEHGFADHEACRFANIFLKHLKEVFLNELDIAKVKSETLIVLPSLQSTQTSTRPFVQGSTHDVNSKIEDYTKQLREQINEWLTSIQNLLPRIHERGFREVVVNDLAGDIIDRFKYLEINPTSKGSDESELEHLKYQIFKWINKLSDEDTLEPSEHASDLMQRIQSIPVPILSRPHTRASRVNYESCPTDSCRMQSIEPYRNNVTVKTASIFEQSCSPSCSQRGKKIEEISPTAEKINNEYEEFVKAWVKKIPISSSTPDEEALAEKARLGIKNGIWKAITKFKCDPSIIGNRFFLEDLLEDEIDELLNCLPQTPELQSTKNSLKLELINKTTEIIERVKAETAKNYRQKLQQNISGCLEKEGLIAILDDSEKAREELEIIRIVELFILQTNSKEYDVVKSEVYKKRLQQQAKKLIDNIKKTHQGETNFNYAKIVTDLVNSLQQVPLPGNDTIKDEVDNVLLEFEIENWFKDLPICRDYNDPVDLLQWKKKTNNLAQQIGDLKKNVTSNDVFEKSIKNLVSNFIDSTPMKVDEMINKNFMIEELLNRIKNIDQSKHVAFNELEGYEDFCKDVPPSSSFNKFLQFKPGDKSEPVNYDAFVERQPPSSSFKSDKENSFFMADMPSSSRMDSVSYKDFSAAKPKSSSFTETPNERIHNLQNSRSQLPHINIQPGTPECCKIRQPNSLPPCCKKQNTQRSEYLDGPSSKAQNDFPEAGRTQKPSLTRSQGIVFKDSDQISQNAPRPNNAQRISQVSNTGTCSAECQTVKRSVLPDNEIGDIVVSDDGEHRNIGTNTPKWRKRPNIDVERKYVDADDSEEDGLRSKDMPKEVTDTKNDNAMNINPNSSAAINKKSIHNYNILQNNNSNLPLESTQRAKERKNKILNWIHDIFHDKPKRKLWNKRLMKLVEKLNTPEGEQTFRKRIYTILEYIDFENKLEDKDKFYAVNYVTDIIKQLFFNDKTLNLNIYRLRTSNAKLKTESLISITKDWLYSLPLKDMDCFDRKVDKSSLINIATKNLLQGISDINKIRLHNFKDNILNAISDIPIDVNFRNKTTFLNKEVNKLIALLLHSDSTRHHLLYTISESRKKVPQEGTKVYEDHIINENVTSAILKEITQIFERSCLSLGKVQTEFIKLKIFNRILTTFKCVAIRKINLKDDIFSTLSDDGNLSDWEARKYTHIIMDRLNVLFNKLTDTPCWIKLIFKACNSDTGLVRSKEMDRKNFHYDDSQFQHQLTNIVKDWMWGFKHQIPRLNDDGFIDNAAKDLSHSVTARQRFLQIYPRKVTPQAESEFLKYLVFIWIKKVFGFEKYEPLKYSNVLLNKIILLSSKKISNIVEGEKDHEKTVEPFSKCSASSIVELKKSVMGFSSTLRPPNGPYANTLVNFANTSFKTIFTPTNEEERKIKAESSQAEQERLIKVDSTCDHVDYYNACLSTTMDDNHVHEFMPIQFIYNHYNVIFYKHARELLVDSFLYDEKLIDKLVYSIVNKIWKIYYLLISDPETYSNDFKMLFENKLMETMKYDTFKLDLKEDWKKTLTLHVNKMFKYTCKEQSICMLRITFKEVIYKDLGITGKEKQDFLIMKVLDNLILHYNFMNKEPFKAYIYKQQFVESLNQIINNINHLSKVQNVDKIQRKIFSIPERIGFHSKNISPEAQVILLRNQFEAWFKTLPLKCNTECENELSRYQTMTILAKNIYVISKMFNNKNSIEREIEKEVINFLQAEVHNGSEINTYSVVKNLLNKMKQEGSSKFCKKAGSKYFSMKAQGEASSDSILSRKSESRVRFADCYSQCSNSTMNTKVKPIKKTSILKKCTKFKDSDFKEHKRKKHCHCGKGHVRCKNECSTCAAIIGNKITRYQENITLDSNNNVVTIIKDVPVGVQAYLPLSEETNTEHLFLPCNSKSLEFKNTLDAKSKSPMDDQKNALEFKNTCTDLTRIKYKPMMIKDT